MAAPVEIEDPKRHRSGSSPEECGWKQGESALGNWAGRTSACGSKESDHPFPVSPPGKAGAGGFPPRRKKRGSPHKRGFAPLCIPRTKSAVVLDRSRPSHGSRDREGAVY